MAWHGLPFMFEKKKEKKGKKENYQINEAKSDKALSSSQLKSIT